MVLRQDYAVKPIFRAKIPKNHATLIRVLKGYDSKGSFVVQMLKEDCPVVPAGSQKICFPIKQDLGETAGASSFSKICSGLGLVSPNQWPLRALQCMQITFT